MRGEKENKNIKYVVLKSNREYIEILTAVLGL